MAADLIANLWQESGGFGLFLKGFGQCLLKT
jgi:hypothetical protein